MCYWLGCYEIFQNVVLFITVVNGTMWLSSLGMEIIMLYPSLLMGWCWSEAYQKKKQCASFSHLTSLVLLFLVSVKWASSIGSKLVGSQGHTHSTNFCRP
jgi:hypothetical protein